MVAPPPSPPVGKVVRRRHHTVMKGDDKAQDAQQAKTEAKATDSERRGVENVEQAGEVNLRDDGDGSEDEISAEGNIEDIMGDDAVAVQLLDAVPASSPEKFGIQAELSSLLVGTGGSTIKMLDTVDRGLSQRTVNNRSFKKGDGKGVNIVKRAKDAADMAQACLEDCEQRLRRAKLRASAKTSIFAGARVVVEVSGSYLCLCIYLSLKILSYISDLCCVGRWIADFWR